MFKVIKDPEFLIENPSARFRPGKLLMLSPKHKQALTKGNHRHIPFIYSVAPPAEGKPDASTFLTSQFQRCIPWLGSMQRQEFVLLNGKALGFGEPFLLVDEPWLVDMEKVTKVINPIIGAAWRSGAAIDPSMPPASEIHRNYTADGFKSVWIMSVLKNDSLGIVMCSPKAWLHYIATVVPLRVSKYDIK